jgi:Domain of unknown function (DU1801)
MAADTPEQYLAEADEPRRGELARLHELICTTLPDLEPHMASGMIGYGHFHYRYASGREGDWFHVGLANRKTGISLYVVAESEDRGYLAERYAERLPKASVGKSCVRFKRLADVDVEVLRDLLEQAGRRRPVGAV